MSSIDGRGTPGRIVLKDHSPRLKLADLLRRRRSTLRAFVAELGVTTHPGLEIWCKRVGVTAPSIEEFSALFPPQQSVNSPQEGVIVLEPPAVIDAETGHPIDQDALSEIDFPPQSEHERSGMPPDSEPREALEVTQKKARRRKESQSNED